MNPIRIRPGPQTLYSTEAVFIRAFGKPFWRKAGFLHGGNSLRVTPDELAIGAGTPHSQAICYHEKMPGMCPFTVALRLRRPGNGRLLPSVVKKPPGAQRRGGEFSYNSPPLATGYCPKPRRKGPATKNRGELYGSPPRLMGIPHSAGFSIISTFRRTNLRGESSAPRGSLTVTDVGVLAASSGSSTGKSSQFRKSLEN